MQRVMITVAGLVALGLFALAFAHQDGLAFWAIEMQRAVQGQMAQALRALQAGHIGALGAFFGLCFAYGLAHAAGPGHGKFLVASYGLARDVGRVRLGLVALAASLAQALAAILLVGAAVAVFGLSRARLGQIADGPLALASALMVAALGLWLVWRGARAARALRKPHSHDHAHDLDAPCASCGHSHGPSPAQIARATRPREILALILAVAIRPCTGAIFVLLLTAQLGIFAYGVIGALAIGLGTGAVTGGFAFLSAQMRQSVQSGLADNPILPKIEAGLALGFGVVLIALSLPFAQAALLAL